MGLCAAIAWSLDATQILVDRSNHTHQILELAAYIGWLHAGWQVEFVVELARHTAARDEVGEVVILTRQIVDDDYSVEYASAVTHACTVPRDPNCCVTSVVRSRLSAPNSALSGSRAGPRDTSQRKNCGLTSMSSRMGLSAISESAV